MFCRVEVGTNLTIKPCFRYSSRHFIIQHCTAVQSDRDQFNGEDTAAMRIGKYLYETVNLFQKQKN